MNDNPTPTPDTTDAARAPTALGRWAEAAPDECRALTITFQGEAQSRAWALGVDQGGVGMVHRPDDATGRALIVYEVLACAARRGLDVEISIGCGRVACDMADNTSWYRPAPDDADLCEAVLTTYLDAVGQAG